MTDVHDPQTRSYKLITIRKTGVNSCIDINLPRTGFIGNPAFRGRLIDKSASFVRRAIKLLEN